MDNLTALRRSLGSKGPISTDNVNVKAEGVIWSPMSVLPRHLNSRKPYWNEFIHTYLAKMGYTVTIHEGHMPGVRKVVTVPLYLDRCPEVICQGRHSVDIDISQQFQDRSRCVPLQLILKNEYRGYEPGLIYGQYIDNFEFDVQVSGDVLLEDQDYARGQESVHGEDYSEIDGRNQNRRVKGQCVIYFPMHCSLNYYG